MFDFKVSKLGHFDIACRAFALKHNIEDIAAAIGSRPQVLRNKLNPEQPHRLADQGACAPWTRGNNCPPVENLNKSGGDLSCSDGDSSLPDFEKMSKKELRALTARLRLVKPKKRAGYKQEITEHQRLQLESELAIRGFDGSEREVDLLLRGGSIPSGAGLRIFYRNQRLQEDDKWRQWYS